MKKIQELPASVTVNLEEDSGVQYPKNGDFETTFELTLKCFTKKNYLQTWSLRQRVLEANAGAMTKLSSLFSESELKNAKEAEDGNSNDTVDVDGFKSMMMMSGFDAVAAMEEFKQFAVVGGLIELDEGLTMNKERWSNVDDDVKELVLFTYLANFIQPCVL